MVGRLGDPLGEGSRRLDRGQLGPSTLLGGLARDALPALDP